MNMLAKKHTGLTAAEFVTTDQSEFGPAWRYELIDGGILAHAAPTPEHGAILANLVTALKVRLKALRSPCRVETGSAATPANKQQNTARIPDALVRCNALPRVTFEIVSPTEMKNVLERDRKREDVKNVDGVVQIVEIYQHAISADAYTKTGAGGWNLVSSKGTNAIIELPSIGISIPLIELYEGAMPENEDE
jgi:Uma2 family endonuclease